MDLYDSLSLKVDPAKAEPAVWVRRVVIYESIVSEVKVVREIPLDKGLNIVWAEETDSDNTSAEITGHSAGKTSFCRLFRYVLGEKSFGTRPNMNLIKKCFPQGYVGAEMFVKQRQWAVLRPIGNGTFSYIKPDATLEELLPDRSMRANEENYPEQLGLTALLDDLDTATIVRTKQTIEWGHVLAWCTRDQEARFQNCYDWRSPRSDSEWPAFRAPKQDALFAMRTLLGLFVSDELQGEEDLAAAIQKREELEKQIQDLAREPQFRVNLYEQELRARIKAQLPNAAGIDTVPFRWDQLSSDLDRLTDEAMKVLQDKADAEETAREKAQCEIDDIGAEIRRVTADLRQIAASFGLQSAALTEIDAAITQRETQRQEIERNANALCTIGGVLYRNCTHIADRQASLKLTQFQDVHAMEQAEATRADAQRALETLQRQLESSLKSLTGERATLIDKRDSLAATGDSTRNKMTELRDARRQFTEWNSRMDKSGEFKALDECRKQLKETEGKVTELTSGLNKLLAQHDSSRALIASIFSGAVRAVLTSGTYNGEVSLNERELSFHITHGVTMSGEAVETLSVLLADVACMIYNSVSGATRLPGLLLHDSPREADLGLRLYRSFIRFVASLQKHFGSAEACPFQYILTTTTAPPEELRGNETVKLPLNAAVPDKLLFRRYVAAAVNPSEQLFNERSR
jgi:hypothetical protein